MTKQTNILLIDDDLMVPKALGQALALENYHVVPVANRHEALHEVEQHPIAIVLLDLDPRGENGWETLPRLTTFQPHLAVVAMTARPERENSKNNSTAVPSCRAGWPGRRETPRPFRPRPTRLLTAHLGAAGTEELNHG